MKLTMACEKEIGGSPWNISLFSMRTSKSYKVESKKYFSKSEIVFNRFCIKKAVNETVDKVMKYEVMHLLSTENDEGSMFFINQ